MNTSEHDAWADTWGRVNMAEGKYGGGLIYGGAYTQRFTVNKEAG